MNDITIESEKYKYDSGSDRDYSKQSGISNQLHISYEARMLNSPDPAESENPNNLTIVKGNRNNASIRTTPIEN